VIVALVIGCYLLGSIPFGVLVGKMRGIDIREAGSGNIGATNAARVLGKRLGAVVLLGDAMKVFMPLVIIKRHVSGWPLAAIALAAFCGHIFSPWLRFRGGKGVASGFGVYLALVPICAAIAAATWALTYALSRLSSLASLLAAWLATVIVLVIAPATPLRALAVAIAVIITLRHRDNIMRLYKGTELKV
jgi:glycerol-3-phosphate acyltransferase PlsY